jgi:[ribosomal protein S18]-alanine N-acetyltransferase
LEGYAVNAGGGAATIRTLNPADAAQVVLLASRCPEIAQWREESYRAVGNNGAVGWIAIQHNVIFGFLLARIAADEMEILNLAVDTSARRQGIARNLVETALNHAAEHQIHRAYLEVRNSNIAARSFYTSQGFEQVGTRQHYYSQPVGDALVLARSIVKDL